ncbi:MAG TPA: hypothetical protein VFJ52_08720, partial [Terriglobia bacterium]|nr:hypothetical protein [Terriglobia bacterium]
MKSTLLAIAGLTLAAAVAEAIVLVQVHIDPWRLAALLESLSLLLGAFVAFTYTDFIHDLHRWTHASLLLAILIPFVLLVPYLILAFGTGTFSYPALARLSAYI